ncbi:prostate stem cell antigen-like [Falco biarmicus]|uniref:Prostate stem cell antigen n=1 Tax=Falco tinnunculus TaxID=100819 RepID=A0A8C4TZ07_FALTI|nr:prostate stem cell antigen-like [Falco cherrug]XP_037237216.1 prostate stem cell antigen-like [Falco rusticolus]XP_055656922.1 prostate stem cell antigen-like [Falco peregrinus]XP_056189607.1 prostate stem cell antigen-like [Falco biarmicus]
MKIFLVLLLGAVLCLDSGSSLQCYSCTWQLRNSNCQKKVDCKTTEMCKTDVIKIIGFIKIINKGCDSSCSESYQDFSRGSRNISCCSSDLCNANAAGSVRCSYGMAAGIAASVLWTFLNIRL